MAQWDPRSYLAEAASRHVMNIDTAATATTIVDYYDNIAAHLSAGQQHGAVSSVLREQQTGGDSDNLAKQQVHSCTVSDEQHRGDEAKVELIEIVGVAMKVPYRVLCGVPPVSVESADGTTAEEVHRRRGRGKEVEEAILACFEQHRKIFSFDEDSELSQLNRYSREGTAPIPSSSSCHPQHEQQQQQQCTTTTATAAIPLSPALGEVVSFAFELHRLSKGAFDPTVGSLTALYKEALEHTAATAWTDFQSPAHDSDSPYFADFAKALELTGLEDCWELVTADREDADDSEEEKMKRTAAPPCSLICKKFGSQLDLCALSKGYIVDRLLEAVRAAAGVDSTLAGGSEPGCLVDWGGDVKVFGLHPTLHRPWRLGFVRPPKLKALFMEYQHRIDRPAGEEEEEEEHSNNSGGTGGRRRKDESTLVTSPLASLTSDEGGTEREPFVRQYLDTIDLDVGCDDGDEAERTQRTTTTHSTGSWVLAAASSGDYEQLNKFGFTHLFDPRLKEPVKVSNHGVAGCTVLGVSCMACDGLATVLCLCPEMKDAIQFVVDWRNREGELERSAALKRYYLYRRDGDTFLHDEDDLTPGECDYQRLAACDREHQRLAAFNSLQQRSAAHDDGSGSVVKKKGGGVTVLVDEGEQQRAILLREELSIMKKLLASIPSVLYAAIVPVDSKPPAAVMDVSSSATATPNKRHRAPAVHVVLLSSVVPLTFDDDGCSHDSRHGPPKATEFLLNVMNGSILYNYVRQPGCTFALCQFDASNAKDAQLLHSNPAEWLKAYGTQERVHWYPRDVDVDGVRNTREGESTAVQQQEEQSYYHGWVVPDRVAPVTVGCTVTGAQPVGDHLLLFATVSKRGFQQQSNSSSTGGSSSSRSSAPRGASSVGVDPVLHYRRRLYYASRHQQVDRTLPVRGMTSSANRRWYPEWVPCTSVGVFIGLHQSHGKMGFPFFQLKMCSTDPLVVTFLALCSIATKGLVDGTLKTQGSELFLLRSLSPPHSGDPFTRQRKEGEVDAETTGTDELPPSPLLDYWRYLPFPAFSNPIPGAYGKFVCDVLDVHFPGGGPPPTWNEEDPGHANDVMVILASVRKPTFLPQQVQVQEQEQQRTPGTPIGTTTDRRGSAVGPVGVDDSLMARMYCYGQLRSPEDLLHQLS